MTEAQKANLRHYLTRALACLDGEDWPQAIPVAVDPDRAALRAEVAGYVAGELERRRETLLTLIVEADRRGDLDAARALSQEHTYIVRRLHGVPLEDL